MNMNDNMFGFDANDPDPFERPSVEGLMAQFKAKIRAMACQHNLALGLEHLARVQNLYLTINEYVF